MASLLLNHTIKYSNAIADLFRLKHDESALILIYSFIDRMAWLSVEGDSWGGDFKKWVESYLLPQDNFLCNANDLWAARCALLHTGSAEARDTQNGKARKIYYTTGSALVKPDTIPQDVVFVEVGMLHSNLIGAISSFQSYLAANPTKEETANTKLKSIVSWVPVA